MLSGYPHLEEAYWFGEGVLPVLAERGLWQHPAPGRHAVARRRCRSARAAGGRVVTAPGARGSPSSSATPSRPAARSPPRTYVARELTGRSPTSSSTSPTSAPRLLDWADAEVAALVAEVGAADLVVVASPTYKATYTGLLKLFLDRFAGRTGLRGVAVPLMLGAGPAHALAPELTLRPVLTEIGATVPVRGLYVLDSRHDDPAAYADWLAAAAAASSTLLTDPPKVPPHDRDRARHQPGPRPGPRCARRSGSSPAASSRSRPQVDGAADRAGRELVHLGEPRPAAGVVLGRQHLQDLAGPAPGRRTSASRSWPTTTATVVPPARRARSSAASTALP